MKTIALFLVFMLSAVSVFAADAAPVAAEVPAPAPLPMERVTAQSIVRLSRVRVDPAHLEEYLVAAKACGAASMEKEPGVLLMYSMQEKEKPEQTRRISVRNIFRPTSRGRCPGCSNWNCSIRFRFFPTCD